MAEFRLAEIDKDRGEIRELFWEYLQWANARVNQEFGVNFDIATMLEEDMEALGIFFRPEGGLILVSEEGKSAGLGCLKKLRDDIGEIKRMYVRPPFRGRGLGRGILEALLAEARKIGYAQVRLDSARFMEAAHTLYRSSGFQEIAPYDESEIPPEFRQHWIFMEKTIVEHQEGEKMNESQAVTVETLKQFLEAFNRHDLDAIMEFFAQDCSMDLPRGPHPWGRRLTGKAEIREGCAGRFKGLPDAHYGDDRHWVCGNRGVSEWTLTGTTPSGERIEVRGTDHLEFRDGKIIRKDSFWKIVEE